MAGASGRNYAPFCRGIVANNFTATNATDMFLGSSAQRVHDNANMLKQAGEAGNGDTSRIRVIIPIAGFYHINWRYYLENGGTNVCSAAVTKNGLNVVTNSIINSQGSSNGWGSACATDYVYLAAGDILYFGMWHNAGGNRTVFATWFGGSQSSFFVKWVGR